MKIWTLVLAIRTAQGDKYHTYMTEHERSVNTLLDKETQKSYNYKVAKCEMERTATYNVILTEVQQVQKKHLNVLPVGPAPFGTHICHDGVEYALNGAGCCDRCGEDVVNDCELQPFADPVEAAEPGVSYIDPDIDQKE